MDLEHWKEGIWILHMIDTFTWYTMAQVITCYHISVAVEMVINNWIRIFGVTDMIVTDNRGEFSLDEVHINNSYNPRVVQAY